MRMLEDAIGTEAFNKTMIAFSRPSQTGQGWQQLASFAQQYAGPGIDVRAFLLPWLEQKSVPRITATASGRNVTIVQEPALFSLPLTVVVTTTGGTERRRLWLRPSGTVITFKEDVSQVQLDPDGLLLLRR